MNIQIDKLRSFVLIAEEKNLTRAAERRFSTPAAVSAQIRQLEDVTNLQLFERTSKGMLLTDAGRQLLPLAYRVIGDLEELKSTANAIAGNHKKRLVLGLNALPELLKIDSVLEMAASNLPDLSLVVRSSNSLSIHQDVLKGQLDLGFVYGGDDHDELRHSELGHIDVVVIASTRTGPAKLPSDPEELASLPWVSPSDSCPYIRLLKDKLGVAHSTANIAATSDDEYSTIAMVKAGLGFGLLERQFATVAASRGEVRVVPGFSGRVSLKLVARKDRYSQLPELSEFFRLVESEWTARGCTTCLSQEKLDGALIVANGRKPEASIVQTDCA